MSIQLLPVELAAERSWATCRSLNVNARPNSRTALEKYLCKLFEAGNMDSGMLAADGLSYLKKLDFLERKSFKRKSSRLNRAG
jgi:hypothetical protein